MLGLLAYIVIGVITGFIIYLMCYSVVKKERSYALDHETLKKKVMEDPNWITLVMFGSIMWPFSLFVIIPGIFFVKFVGKGYEYLIDKIYGEKKNDK